MTAAEIRYNILLGVDSLYENVAPGYNDKQMSSIINRAQRRVFRDYAKRFDEDEKIKRILAPLIKGASLGHSDMALTTDTSITNYTHSASSLTGTFLSLPQSVARIMEEKSKWTSGDTTTDWVIVYPVTYDYYMKNYNNRYKRPYAKLAWRMDAAIDSDGYPCIELIYNNAYTLSDYVIYYLRYPNDIVVNTAVPGSAVDPEVPDPSFHDEIVGEAIKIIVTSLNEEGYQNASIEKKFDEN